MAENAMNKEQTRALRRRKKMLSGKEHRDELSTSTAENAMNKKHARSRRRKKMLSREEHSDELSEDMAENAMNKEQTRLHRQAKNMSSREEHTDELLAGMAENAMNKEQGRSPRQMKKMSSREEHTDELLAGMAENAMNKEQGRSPRQIKKVSSRDEVDSIALKPRKKRGMVKPERYSPPLLDPAVCKKIDRLYVFGSWAHVIAMYAAFTSVVLATGGIFFQMREDNNDNLPEEDKLYFAPDHAKTYVNWKFRYANFAGLGIGAFELLLRLALRSSGPPFILFVRALLLALFAAAGAFSFFLLIPCTLYSIAALFTFVAVARSESGSVEHFSFVAVFRAMKHMIGRCCCVRARQRTHRKKVRGVVLPPSWWHYQVARGFIARLFLFVLWFVITVALGFKNYVMTMSRLEVYKKDPNDATCWIKDGDKDTKCIRYGDAILTYLPIAKACGYCLDFNCALILLLVVQSFVTKFNEFIGRKSNMLLWVPAHKLLLFHKFLGAAVFLLSLVHTYAHYMAHSFVLDLMSYITTFTDYFGHVGSDWIMTSAWISGMLVFVLMVIVYSSIIGPAKNNRYSFFLKVHVAFAMAFFILLFYHAQQFLFTGIIPFILYLQDRARRSVSEETSLRLTEVELIDSVLAVSFVTPFKYKSGTYCRLRCPNLIAGRDKEWHPFTISSAYSSNIVGFHIKVHPGGWTEQLRDLMVDVARASEERKLGTRLVDNESGFRYQFKAKDWLSGNDVLGLSPTWMGKPLIVCSAPHAAPAMHHDQFETIIIAGAGIGLTPVNSVITEILHYKWRKGADTKVKNIYAAWMCPHNNVHAFRWFMESASNCDLAYTLCDSKAYHYEMHIFVTSASAVDETSPLVVPTITEQRTYDSDAVTAIRPYTAQDLLNATKAAQIPVSQFAQVMTNVKWRNAAFGRTKIWNGRPDWEELFQRISDRHADVHHGHRVGVFFCGPSVIVDSVRHSAQLFTSKAISFHVFKENF